MGGVSPQGHRLAVNSQSLMLDGKPWLPVMGEFHYSRYPEKYWREELLKMKAGGVPSTTLRSGRDDNSEEELARIFHGKIVLSSS